MLSGFWQWLHEINWLVGLWRWLNHISQSQATFLGWVVGVVTLVGGALLNARLNRRRDDRLRREEQRAMATALRAELDRCRQILVSNSESLEKGTPDAIVPTDLGGKLPQIMAPELGRTIRIMPHMIPKLGLLDQETIKKVINAYLELERHGEKLLLLGGHLHRLK